MTDSTVKAIQEKLRKTQEALDRLNQADNPSLVDIELFQAYIREIYQLSHDLKNAGNYVKNNPENPSEAVETPNPASSNEDEERFQNEVTHADFPLEDHWNQAEYVSADNPDNLQISGNDDEAVAQLQDSRASESGQDPEIKEEQATQPEKDTHPTPEEASETTEQEEAPNEVKDEVIAAEANSSDNFESYPDSEQPNTNKQQESEEVAPDEKVADDNTLPQERPTKAIYEKFKGRTTALHEKLKERNKGKSLADKFQGKPIHDLKRGLELNQRAVFIQELFDGDKQAFYKTLDHLNKAKRYEEAMAYLEYKIKPRYNWDEDSETVTNFLELVYRRFIDS